MTGTLTLDRDDTHRLALAAITPRPACPAWCVDCWGPAPTIPGDETMHNGVKTTIAVKTDAAEHQVSVRLFRFDENPASGLIGDTEVYLSIDEGEGVDLTLDNARALVAALTAAIAQAERR